MDELQRKLDTVRQKLASPHHKKISPKIFLGYRSGQPFYLEGNDLDNSMHIMGATREGKSKQIENIYRQFIEQDIGGAVIDPHGYLYDDLLAYSSYQSARHRKILDRLILFDPGDIQHIVGFNTLQQIQGHAIDTLTLSRMYATIKARGKDNFDDMPTAKTWLQNIFHPLIKKGLTLIEARYLIDRGIKSNPIARAIVEDAGIDLIEHDWAWYAEQSKRTQYEELLSSVNMLRGFVTSDRMELIFGRLNKVLNLRQIMDDGKILLVNLSSRELHKDIARLVGTFLVNEFFLVAMTRPEGSRPFYLAIDEFENYVTQDIADILDQGHKFGLRLILAHHSLEQLREQNKRVYTAVMQNAKIKILYGGLTYENAETMAQEIFSYFGEGGLDPMKEKHVQKSPYIHPHETTRKVHTEGETSANSSGTARQSGLVFQSGETVIPIDSAFLSEQVINYVRSESRQSSETSQTTNTSGYNFTDAIIPFIEQELKWYESGIQYFSLEEQLFHAAARLKNLPQQICMIKLPKDPVCTVNTAYVKKHHRLKDEVQHFADRLNQLSPSHMTAVEARSERDRISSELLALQIPDHPTADDDDRWQK